MTEIDHVTLPAFRYFAGESENICRLCFGDTENGVFLDESRVMQGQYFDDTVTYEDMLTDFGAVIDPSLPKMLCEYCADIAINSFLFKKLCLESYNKWQQNLEKFDKTLDLSGTLNPTVKTAYLLIQKESNLILKSQKIQKDRNKVVALKTIQDLLRARKTYEKVKKKADIMCEECGKKFPSPSYLTRHMIVHSNKKYPCPECLKVFSSQPHLKDHSARIHRPKTIECLKCAKKFSTEKMLKYHNSAHHTAAICKLCFKRFPSKMILRQHLDNHEVNKCPRCDKEFVNKTSFKVHMKICGTQQKNLKLFCDLCGKGYAARNGLIAHLITMHGFGHAYSCKWCNKPFDAVSKLRNHVVKHTRERNFHCEQCGGQFVTRAALVYHTRIHTGEKPFPCDLCDESFLSASRRMEHKRRKHLGPSQECNICHSKFVTNHELQKHVARHKNPQSRLFVSENDGLHNNSPQKRKMYVYF